MNKTILTGAAVAGLLSGSFAVRANAATNTTSASGTSIADAGTSVTTLADKAGAQSCKGQNSCKGKGGCKSGDSGCKGKNSCKGKGGCSSTDKKK